MPIINVDLTPVIAAGDFVSATRYRAFPVKTLCPECPTVECNCPCPNDATGGGYLVAEGDKIHLQFFFEDLVNADPTAPTLGWFETGDLDYFVKLGVYDLAGNNLVPVGDGIEAFAESWAVWHDGTQSVQQVTIDASDLIAKLGLAALGCFYFCVSVKSPTWEEFETVQLVSGATPDPDDYEDGDVVLAGSTFYQLAAGTWTPIGGLSPGELVYEASTGQWYTLSGTVVIKVARPEVATERETEETLCCTRTYKIVRCEDTVLICSTRTSGKDCRGYVYDRATGAKASRRPEYRFCTRVPGSFEPIAYPVQRKISEDGVVIRGGYSERARFRTDGICRADAESIAAILSSEDFTIDGQYFDTVSDVEKNNDEGSLWYLDITLERTICDGKNDCDFTFE